MKKWMTLLLCCVLALNLTACGAGAPGGPEDNAPPQASALHFEVATQVYENEYKADDGTVLLAERYELPVLELRTEDGELYTLAENVTANGGTGNPAQFTAQNAFNTEMNNVLAGLESEAAQMATEAKELYAENGTSVFLNGSYWTNELSLTQTYMTEGKLLSIAAENYTYYGGVHPNSATRAWSFDLTTGEFLTLDALASEEGDLQGNSLQESIYWNIYEQIAQKGLSEGYFDDYDSYLQDFPTLATLNFTENGLTVTFDQYVIAPYAAVDGNLYDLADIKGVETLEGLRALLLRYVTPELADEWLGSTEQRYRDIDGRLYVMSAGRGGNESLGGYTCTAALDGDSGVLTQTVTLLAWDDTAQAWADTGKTEAYEYPFTLVDGHAVFSAFPCPY